MKISFFLTINSPKRGLCTTPSIFTPFITVTLTRAEIDAIPTFSVFFGFQEYIVSVREYLFPVGGNSYITLLSRCKNSIQISLFFFQSTKRHIYLFVFCLFFLSTQFLSSIFLVFFHYIASINILGASWMQTYIVNFDVANSRIGIAYPPGASVPATVAPFPIPPGVSPGIAPAPRRSNYGIHLISL